jgi:hypothetical protein
LAATGYATGLASKNEIAALLRKYEEILRLRRLAAAGDVGDPRRAMAALALEFPGALREADALPLSELEHRVGALRDVQRALAPSALWMDAITRFHALTRGALCAKAWLRGRRTFDEEATRAFTLDATTLCYGTDANAWKDDLARLANPPRGRVTDLVFERLASQLGIELEEAKRLVFGHRVHGAID